MAINRAPFNALVDDDGSGNVGTVWNKNQIKGVLLDPIDALFPGNITWTPTDASGAGLALISPGGIYRRIDQIVFVAGVVQYPNNANSLGAKIGGLPFPVHSSAGNWLAATFSYMSANQQMTLLFSGGTSQLSFFNLLGQGIQNSALANQALTFSGFYFI